MNLRKNEMSNQPGKLTYLAYFVVKILGANIRNWEEKKFLFYQCSA